MREKIEKAYWKGYIAKQNEAMEICKQCKYVKKARQLEIEKQKLIEKLEKENNNDIILQQIFNALYDNETKSKLDTILSIVKEGK